MSEELRLTDAQKSAAIESIGENMVLRSGAGCGKTFVLARRFTELLMNCRDAENPLSRFVALTFTEKAAVEMSQRVRDMLAGFAAGSKGADRRRLLRWLEELSEARISTIHSFCASLLRGYAVEAGVDPNFAVCADELEVRRMVMDAADQAVLAAAEGAQGDAADLLAEMPYATVVEAVARLVQDRTACVLTAYTGGEVILRRWRELLEKERQEAISRLAGEGDLQKELTGIEAIDCSDPSDRLNTWRADKLALVREILTNPAGATAEDFKPLSKSPRGVGSDKNWGGKGSAKRMRERLKFFLAAVTEYGAYFERLGETDRKAAESLATLCRLALKADDIYSAAKRRRGVLDFTDLLYHTRRLLALRSDI
ncbi:MAG: UvrD-helicase domain-containing protein, partial [Phycisphaerae bacterium]|nr:UvrD-helicase domain-containing protein [Phycisphaerae bacterium]